MKGKLIMTSIIIAFVVGFFVITTATANVVEINPDNDAYVKDIDPNTNYGSLAALIVGDYTSSPPVNIHRSYLMFDLGSLPSGAVINTAELYLYNSWLSYPAVDVGAHYLSNDGWNEGSITWNNAPTGFNSTATDLNTISMCEWTSWDVTPDVQATWAGDGVYSVVMKEPSADEGQDANNLGFDSKEAGAGHEHPYLRIRYTILPPAKPINGTVDLAPYFDWGAISSYAGLTPPGNMGIWDIWHQTNFYFPSDSLSPNTTTPKAWLITRIHWATFYGPANMLIPTNPIVTVPDRYFRPCSLRVRIPYSNLIDDATDLNVIQISSGERKTISMTYFKQPLETMVFLANCDGGVFAPGFPSPDQPLRVLIYYQDATQEIVDIDSIHPAARDNNIYWGPYFTYGNEVFGCGPPYFDLIFPDYDHAHSEFWHWYTLYPDTTKLLDSIAFSGIQPLADTTDIHILSISYHPCCNHDGMRGDVNYDFAGPNIADLTYLVDYLFRGGPEPPCFEEGDVNGDGSINVADLTYLVDFLFRGGPPPPPCP